MGANNSDWDWKWIFALLFPVGMVMYFSNNSDLAEHNEVLKQGLDATGYPTAIQKSGRRSSSDYFLDLEYDINGQTFIVNKHKISSKLYSQLERGLKNPVPLKIKYMNNNPKRIAIVGDTPIDEFDQWFSIGMMAVGLLGGAYAGIAYIMKKKSVNQFNL